MYKGFRKTGVIAAILISIIAGVFYGCSKDSSPAVKEGKPQAAFTNISSAEAKKRLDSEKDIILLDVRTEEEYQTGHIKGALLIPVDTLEKEAEAKIKDKEVAIIVYCRSGNRSVTAANILIRLGYKNVYNLGGIKDWPYEVEK